jgi:hypothetical protein
MMERGADMERDERGKQRYETDVRRFEEPGERAILRHQVG